ncbi:head-tail connector protein [Thalassovita sp.]|uniref:head-tail connector protein n=1 Tax=Thalassovita sp. TaxID=1979401 RepID=UPI002AB1E20C|nr:hypothetical protein [Thalassovita sp.]
MKMLVQRFPSEGELPFDLEDLKLHIRVDGDSEDDAVTNIGLTAAAELEQFAQIALLTQTIRVTIFDLEIGCGIDLPIGPVADTDTPIVIINGSVFTAFDFVGGNRPHIRWRSANLTRDTSRIVIEYQAGFGAAAADIPSDLSQALMDQAALHYDGRSPMDAKSLTTSPHMARVGARYRGVMA